MAGIIIIIFYSSNPQESLEGREGVQVSCLDLIETLEQPQRGATSVNLIFISHEVEISILNLQTSKVK